MTLGSGTGSSSETEKTELSGELTVKRTILLVLLLCLLPAGVLAAEVDMGYTGIIDSFTGLPEGQYAVPEGVEQIQLSNSLYYNFPADRYIYTVDAGPEVRCSVADGMVTNGPVSVEFSSGASGRLYRNGEALTDQDLSMIEEPGSYTVSVNGNNGLSVQPFSFTVVNALTGVLDKYELPTGFVFTGATRDGDAIDYTADRVDLSEEGSYVLTYLCQSSCVAYSLEITVDHTPPTLALTAVEDGAAKGPVDISDLESGASIRVKLDGKELYQTDLLTETGSYHIWVQDAAGNTTEYQFRILTYLNTSAVVFVTLAAALCVFLVIYIVYSRKKLRIR